MDNTWAELPNRLLFNNTYGDSAVHAVVRSKLFQIGGGSKNIGGQSTDALFTQVLDLNESEEWKLGFVLKEITDQGCAVTLSDERVAVLGSWRLLFPYLLDGVHVYDVEDGTSVQLKHLGIGRKALGCTSYVKNRKEYILAAGGLQLEGGCFGDLCSK